MSVLWLGEHGTISVSFIPKDRSNHVKSHSQLFRSVTDEIIVIIAEEFLYSAHVCIEVGLWHWGRGGGGDALCPWPWNVRRDSSMEWAREHISRMPWEKYLAKNSLNVTLSERLLFVESEKHPVCLFLVNRGAPRIFSRGGPEQMFSNIVASGVRNVNQT